MYLHFLSCMNYLPPLAFFPFISPLLLYLTTTTTTPPPPPHTYYPPGPEAKHGDEVSVVTRAWLALGRSRLPNSPRGSRQAFNSLGEKAHTHTAWRDYHTHTQSQAAREGGDDEVNGGKQEMRRRKMGCDQEKGK